MAGDDFVFRAKQQNLRCRVVCCHAVNAKVVFGVFAGEQARFGGFYGTQDGGLPAGIFIHANAQIDFFGAGFGFEGFAQAENGVG